MLKHHVRVAFRQLRKHTTYTGINILGLAIALACTLVVYAFVTHEYSYDRFHEKTDRIVRIIEKQEYPTGDLHVAVTPFPLGPRLEQDFHEVESTARLYLSEMVLNHGDSRFYQYAMYADSAFLGIFSFDLVAGDAKTALARTHSIVLSSEVAKKLFGDSDPLGQVVQADAETELTVTGVLKPLPKNSHLEFEVLVSMPTASDTWPAEVKEQWGRNAFTTYALLRPGVDRNALAARLERMLDEIRGEDQTTLLYAQPLADIHLGPSLVADMGIVSDPRRLYAFVIAALLVLIVAGLNYINLATAHALLRARELGVRSCLGAHLGQLRRQIVGETMVTIGISAILAVVLAEATFSLIEPMLGTSMARDRLLTWSSLPALVGVWLASSLIIGMYLALVIARPRPSRMLREQPLKKSRLRAALVVVQFAASVAMVIMASVILLQQRYAKSTNLAAHGEQILIVPLRGDEARSRLATLQQEFSAIPGVRSVSAIAQIPTNIAWSSTYSPEGMPPDQAFLMNENPVDAHFFATFDLDIVAGRTFRPGDTEVCIINRSAAQKIGWDEPVGKVIDMGRFGQAAVVGVVEDFHFSSLRDELAPLILYPQQERYRNLALRLDDTQIESAASAIEARFTELCPSTPYYSLFLDQNYDRLYGEEKRTHRTLTLFAALAILLACLGLYGLTAFSIQRRTKEVGIRKVFGATVQDIVTLQTREYFLWVTMANVAGLAVGYYLSQQWLQQYAYRTAVPWWLFVSVVLASLALVAATVSIQTIRAASANPIQALRHE